MIVKGLGDTGTTLGPLARAFANGEIKANPFTGEGYLPIQSFKDAFGTNTAPGQDYLSDGVASQIASLLDGHVVKRKPGGLVNAPDANFIALPNGYEVNAGDVASLAAPYGVPQLTGLSKECSFEYALTSIILGIPYSGSCQAERNGNQPAQDIAKETASTFIGGGSSGTYYYKNGEAIWNDTPVNNKGGTTPVVTTHTTATQTQQNNGAGVVDTVQSLLDKITKGNLLTNTATIHGQSVPYWVFGLVGVAAIYMISKRD